MADDQYRIFAFKDGLVAQLDEHPDAAAAVDALSHFMATVAEPGLLIIAPPGSVTPDVTGHVDQVDVTRGVMTIVPDRLSDQRRISALRDFAGQAARDLAGWRVAATASAAARALTPGRRARHVLDERG